MKLSQVLFPVAALAGIAAAFFGAYQGGKSAVGGAGGVGTLGKIGNSPIMATGGSMTFRAVGGWNCDSVTTVVHGQSLTYHTKCASTASVPLNSIDWDNVIPASFGTLGWAGLSTPWTLDLYARNLKGKVVAPSNTAAGVRMCTTSSNVIASAMCGGALTYLLIAVEGNSVDPAGVLGLMDSSVNDQVSAEQYFDSGCTVHTASADDKTLPGCEHPGYIVSSIDSNLASSPPVYNLYRCKDGNCQIAIDK